MGKIIVENLYHKMITTGDRPASFLKHFHDHQMDWMHACGGKGRCTTCKIIIVKGAANICEPTSAEIRFRRQNALKENERLSCQAIPTGDVTIMVPAESKLPHIKYSDD